MKILKIIQLTIILGLFSTPFSASAYFSDVPKSHPNFEAITELENELLVKGYQDGTFRPDELINKAAFHKLVFNHAGYKPVENFYETPFLDVNSGAWYSAYVKKALELNIIKFNPDLPKFLPQQPVSRYDGLKTIYSLHGVPVQLIPNSSQTAFIDISNNPNFLPIAKTAESTGIFIAEEQPYLLPLRNLTRGEAAELLYKVRQYQKLTNTSTAEIFVENSEYEYDADLLDSEEFAVFADVYKTIKDRYYEDEEINESDLIYGAIDGMVDSIGDPYSNFESPSTSEEFTNDLNGNYEGIGVMLDQNDQDQYYIIYVLMDSPAEESGLAEGDIILEIDGKKTDDLTSAEVTTLIKGPKGTDVVLTINREGTIKEITVTRNSITFDTVFDKSIIEVPQDIAYISIFKFGETTASEFNEMLNEKLEQNPKGLILDLRDNPGGYLDSAYTILEKFIEKDLVMTQFKLKDRTAKEFAMKNSLSALQEIPVVVLVNDLSASAAEVIAAALQDHQKATIIGTQTFGKGTVQELTLYHDGSLLKLSIAKWLSPKGHDYNLIGLTPDIIVEPSESDFNFETDSQLEKAIQHINQN
ncbi:PDZ domain-containing protein [Candidatus Peregrinibacteria bacterium]|nr:PDZ domain-containing protein [Candidatus Peregrinibacteria bacterium]